MTNHEFTLKVLKNMGHDTTCGACMSIAFTGSIQGKHTCKKGFVIPSSQDGIVPIDGIIDGLNNYREEFRSPVDHLYFLQAMIAASLKEIGAPKELYLTGCNDAWDGIEEEPISIPQNKH